MMKLWSSIGIIFAITLSGQSQQLTSNDIDFLNKEIRFLNESIHRMVIVFQVYENYNSEITRHVDLPSNEGIKNTSAHLPENLFADNNLVRRGDSPLELFDAIKEDPQFKTFPINNSSLLLEVRKVIDLLNMDRNFLDNIIKNEDLEKFSNIQIIYEEIGQAITLYDKVRNTVKIFEKLILESYHDLPLPSVERQVFTAITELHYDVKKIVRQLRDDNQSGVINGVSKLQKELGWVKTCISQLQPAAQKSDLLSVIVTVEKLIDQITDYVNGAPIPTEYVPFGKGYYFHNYEILPKINQYGSGYVWKLEEFFRKYNWPVINFLEEPHYLKIVYPDRIPLEIIKGKEMDPNTDIRTISQPVLPQVPHIVVEKPGNVPIVINDNITVNNTEAEEIAYLIIHSQEIKVDTAFFDIYLFDHLQKDGDRVSINVNGEWLFRNISLERKSRKLKLSINPDGPTYIVIKAENEGWRTPNTIGVKYRSKIEGNSVFIKRDLGTNEALELKFIN